MDRQFIETVLAEGLVIDNPEAEYGHVRRGRGSAPLFALELPEQYRRSWAMSDIFTLWGREVAVPGAQYYPYILFDHTALDSIRGLVSSLRCPVCHEEVKEHTFERTNIMYSLYESIRFDEHLNISVLIEPWMGFRNTQHEWHVTCPNSMTSCCRDWHSAALERIVEHMVNNRLAILSIMETWDSEHTYINIKGQVERRY